ncbi:TylF/MycF/NovP-related O-methyltransferase [Hylemonella sp. W303a]|uniref:TylF/MycF/NovP-related O-methyltransferase n=1 Tax=Hylemonella sp. W303a TaxID=3389873 RepID=UPI00396B1C22
MKSLLKRLWGGQRRSAVPAELRDELEKLLHLVREANITYCGIPKLQNLRDAALRVRAEGVPGDFLECGVALGGSAILLAKCKPADVPLRLYDVFAMIPPPGPADGEDAHQRYEVIRSGASAGLGDDVYYGYRDNLMDQVRDNLVRFGVDPVRDQVSFVRGLFDDTLHPPGPVAFAHIDCDWYEPVRTCMARIIPRLSPGGVLVFDDYSSYSGCRKAVDELLQERSDFEKIFERRSVGIRLRSADDTLRY